MTDINKNLVEKYLDGTASEEEAGIVLDWFQTTEGQKYAEKRFDRDVECVEELGKAVPVSPDAAHTLKRIETLIGEPKLSFSRINRLHRHPSVLAVAACIVFLVAVVPLMENYFGAETALTEEPVPVVVHSTGDGEQKTMTLTDGSTIRLSENSRIEMPEVFDSADRTVTLEGQAFFEITADKSRPFIVHIGEAQVRVLGTAFNVKESVYSDEVFVAVSEGKVSLSSPSLLSGQEKILEKNTIGLFDVKTHEITKEAANIHNYMSWIHGRVVFDRTPFPEVISQLERIYDIESTIVDEELLDLRLTADFSERSPDNVLEVIAHSLEIDFEKKGDAVSWRVKGKTAISQTSHD
ncbi:MAG: FecR domain-containing protein [Balneolaceae bacterium]